MSDPSPLPEVELPKWVGTPLTGAGVPGGGLEAIDNTAIGSDIAGAAGDYSGVELPGMNLLGGVATGLKQYEQSIAQDTAVRIIESVAAGAIDMTLGSIPGVPGGWQPLVPVLDALFLAPISEDLGANLGIADNINGLLRGLAATVDSKLSSGGGEVSEARARARAEVGDMGEVPRLLTKFWHWVRATDMGQ